MPRNGSGVYSLPAGNPVVTGTIISSTWANTTLTDIANALTQSVAKDGQTPITSNINMGGNLITNLGDGINLTDVANIKQIQNQAFNWCGTAGGTANALTISPSPATEAYVAGQHFVFKASLSNTATATVAVSGLAPKTIKNLGANLSAGDITINQYYRITYDGTNFQLEGLFLFGSGAGFLPLTGGTMTGNIVMNGAVDVWNRGSNIASATTTDLSAATGNTVFVTGNTTITGFGTMAAGTVMLVKFSSATTPLLTNSATLVLPGGANIQTAQDDWLIAVSLGGGSWEVPSFLPASGIFNGGGSSGVIEEYKVVGLVCTNTDEVLTADATGVVVQNPTTFAITGIDSPATININITTAGPIINGRDQAGAFAAETWVHFYYIYNATTDTLAGIASGSPPSVGPTLPSGYTRWAYIHAIYLDASSDLTGVSIFNSLAFFVTTPIALNDGTAGTSTSVDLASIIPPNCENFQIIMLLALDGGGASANAWQGYVEIVSGAETLFAQQRVFAAASTGINTSIASLFPNVGQEVFYKVVLVAGSTGQGHEFLYVPYYSVRN